MITSTDTETQYTHIKSSTCFLLNTKDTMPRHYAFTKYNYIENA